MQKFPVKKETKGKKQKRKTQEINFNSKFPRDKRQANWGKMGWTKNV